jgi:hypothetical protein
VRIPLALYIIISNICPDISVVMIEKTLYSLLKDDYIVKVGRGKSTSYIRSIN